MRLPVSLPSFIQFSRDYDVFSVLLSTNQDTSLRWNDFPTKHQLIGFVSRILYLSKDITREIINDLFPPNLFGVKMLYLSNEIRTNWYINIIREREKEKKGKNSPFLQESSFNKNSKVVEF